MPPSSSARVKVQLKLAVQRLKSLQEKKSQIAKRDRRDVASLVERGKLETARIKTEGIIAEDIHVELLEVLELYAEMLIARFALLDLPNREPDAALVEPLCALIHAAPRTELRELHVLREMLMGKFTREFAIRATENQDDCVPARVVSRLKVETQQPEYVDAYIAEVCRAYDVPFSSPHVTAAVEPLSEAPPAQPDISPLAAAATRSDAKVASETGTSATPSAQPPGGVPAASTTQAAEKKEPEVDDLEKRFAALKKR